MHVRVLSDGKIREFKDLKTKQLQEGQARGLEGASFRDARFSAGTTAHVYLSSSFLDTYWLFGHRWRGTSLMSHDEIVSASAKSFETDHPIPERVKPKTERRQFPSKLSYAKRFN
jgi:hypothetical protein